MYEPLERPPIDTSHLSLVLTVPPARVEAGTVLAEWVGHLNGSELDYEILLVSEEADRPVDELAVSFSRVRPLPPPERRGFGAALRLGLDQAQHPLVFYARCDRCYRPAELKRLLQVIAKVDLVAGQRTLAHAERTNRVRDRLYRWFVRALFGVRLRDLGCLFVLARRSIFARIPIQSQGLFAHTEVLAKANFLGCYFSDVPVSYQPPTATDAVAERVAWSDMRRVISHPDFGPVHFPTEPAPAATPTAELEP